MPASSAATHKDIKSVLESRPLKFRLQTKGAKYECQIHSDRSSYERSKPARASSASSIESASSSGSK